MTWWQGVIAGWAGHKVWRAAWQARKWKRPIVVAMRDEFAPNTAETPGRRRQYPHVTEIG